MGAFKQLLSTDVTVVPFVVNKNFYFQGFNELTGSSFDFLIGNNIPDYPNPSSSYTTGLINTGSYQKSIFNSIKQLYYTNYLNTNDFYLYIWPNNKFLPTSLDDIGIDNYTIGSQFSQSFGSNTFYNLFDFENLNSSDTWLIQASKESYYSPFHYNSANISRYTVPEFTTKFTGKLSYNLYISSSDTPESASLAVLKNNNIVYTSSYFSSSFNLLNITASGELDVLTGDKLKFGFLSTPTNNNIQVLSSITLQLTQQEGASKTLVTDYDGNIIENDSTSNIYYRYDNYDETTLYTNQGFPTQTTTFRSESKFFPQLEYGKIRVLSIPKNLYGEYIKPKTFFFQFDAGASNPKCFDDGNGFLRISSSANNPDAIAGYISYKHGLAILPIYSSNNIISQSAALWTTTGSGITQPTCSFQSTRTIYETQYKCTIRPDEFNYSLNPSLISGSTDGTVYNFVTSSYFAPYVTTVGLYNENQELLAVAKLAQPLPTSRTTDTTIIINLDM